jgi:hypothetical protein
MNAQRVSSAENNNVRFWPMMVWTAVEEAMKIYA